MRILGPKLRYGNKFYCKLPLLMTTTLPMDEEAIQQLKVASTGITSLVTSVMRSMTQ